jgi:hypothetical protein
MTKIKIITASSPEGLNKKVQDMIAEGWEPMGSHSAVVIHSQNRYAGSQHMDTTHETEYSITMKLITYDPKIETGVYWYEDESGKKVYDEDEMRNEFENKLLELVNNS